MPDDPKPSSPNSSDDWRRLHLWHIQPVRDGLFLLGVFGVLYLGSVLSLVTVPLLLALALAYLFEPVIRRLTRLSWMGRRGAASTIIVATILAVLAPTAIGGAFAVVQGVDFTSRLASNVSKLQRSVEKPENQELYEALPNDNWRSLRDRIVEATSDESDSGVRRIINQTSEWVKENATELGERAISTGAGAIGAVVGGVGKTAILLFGAFLTFFFFFFFSVGYADVLSFGEKLIPEKNRSNAIRLLQKMDVVIASFIRGRLVIGAILGVLFTIGYWAAGVPAALLIGPLTGLLSIVPYASMISLPVAALLLYLEPNAVAWKDEWWWTLFGPVVVFVPLQMLDEYVLTPLIQGKETGMDTPAILFASVAGGVLAGPYGVLVAIPTAACVKIVLTEVLWPRIQAWTRGEAEDPLPIGRRKD